MKGERALVLTTDVFMKGGVQRYSRGVVDAIRHIAGEEAVSVFVVNRPDTRQFETSIDVDYVGGGTGWVAKARYGLRVLGWVARHRGDLGLVWCAHLHLGPLGAVAARLSGCPYVVNAFGHEIWSRMSPLRRRALVNADRVVSDCHFTAGYIEENFPIEPKRVRVNWDPVDLERFRPLEEVAPAKVLGELSVTVNDRTHLLLTLGRLDRGARHKGYDRIIELMTELEASGCEYIIAGEGDDRRRLEQKVRDLGLERCVHFTGEVDERDLCRVYNCADLFVLVSDRGENRGEGIPLTPLEAQACGVPAVVGDEDGSQEAVVDGETGFIVSPRDRTSIYQAIRKFCGDGLMQVRMGESARELVEERFSRRAFRERTAEIVGEVCGT